MQGFLTKPFPIIFAFCQAIQQLADGAINLLGIYSGLTVWIMPDGTRADVINVPVVTVWTGGLGEFEQVIRVRDQEGQIVAEMRFAFALKGTSDRHTIAGLMALPVREGPHTVTVSRGDDDEELSRQDFVITIAPFPGTAT